MANERRAWWAAGIVGAIVAGVHLAAATRYGIFVNELYFIVCGRHPAFGYVDQPPLVPLLAAASQAFGIDVWLLRLPAVLSAIAIVPLTVAFALLMGANVRGAWMAAVASACAPLVVAMSAALTTSTFEPLVFTGVAYLVARAILRDEPASFAWAGVVAGLGFEAKYGVLLWLAGLAIGIAACGPRRALRSRALWIGAGVAAAIALPNALWQLAHGLPFLELVRNDNARNLTGSPLAFTLDQIFAANVLLAPLWIAGIVAPFVSPRLAPLRYLSIAFVATAALVVVTHGKSYYLAGAYPTIFALGAAAVSRIPTALVAAWAVLAAANGALALPLVLPVLSPARLQQALNHMAFRPPPIEADCVGAPLMCVFSGEFGWRELAHRVEAVYAALPPEDRSKAAILTSNYAEAAAIDVYGTGLPPALSGNNQYYLWGPRGYEGSVVIAIGFERAALAPVCRSVTIVGRYGFSPYALPFERNRPIAFCRGMHPALPDLWPTFKRYGVEYWAGHAFTRP